MFQFIVTIIELVYLYFFVLTESEENKLVLLFVV